MGEPDANPMGLHFMSLIFGLGFVMSFGYWCTDFLVVQRAMIARNMGDAPEAIKRRHVENCMKCDPAYGAGVAKALGLK